MKPFSFTSFWKSREGNVLILTGLAILFLVGIAGAGVDLGRQQLMRIKLQQSADAAALAAGSLPDGSTESDQMNTALRYFNLNFPATYLDIARPTPVISVGNTIDVSAEADVPTRFVGNFGVASLHAAGASEVASNSTSITQKYDLILVMDNSGSMIQEDVGTVNIREASAQGIQDGYNACVYYVTHFPNSYSEEQADAWCSADSGAVWGYRGHVGPKWGTLGASRINALRYAADYISNSLLNPNTTGSRVAAVMWDTSVFNSQDLTGDYPTMSAKLDDMYARYGTASQTGLAQAQTFAGGFAGDAVHAVILITDGENNTPSVSAANRASLTICSAFKAQGTLVYTIAFGADVVSDPVAQNFLSSCASTNPSTGTPYFFIAPDSATLQGAFTTILSSVKKVRIAK